MSKDKPRRSAREEPTSAESEKKRTPARARAEDNDPVTTSREPPLASAKIPARADGGDELPEPQRTIQPPEDRPLRSEVDLARGPAAERPEPEKEG